jgi:hypothetical protein
VGGEASVSAIGVVDSGGRREHHGGSEGSRVPRLRWTMRISVDDWHFRESDPDLLVLDVFLDNGQHAVMEVSPMKKASNPNGDIPEMIMFCEMPGEKIAEEGCPARWVTRPPTRECPWSNVQIPQALILQIKDRLRPGTPVHTAASDTSGG